jgi:hypothetical protein
LKSGKSKHEKEKKFETICGEELDSIRMDKVQFSLRVLREITIFNGLAAKFIEIFDEVLE